MNKTKLLLILFAVAAPGAARGAELCVSCEGPEAVYRCEPEGFGPGDSRAAWTCVTELAKLEGHKSCAIDRRAAGPCDGPLRVVRRDLAPDLAASQDNASARPIEIPENPPPETSPTVAGALKKAGQSAAEQIQGAGESAGAAAKKAWNCVASFGKNC